MRVRDIMIKDVYTVNAEDSVRTVLEKFAQLGISGMPIVDADRRLVGYISDGDIMRFLGRHGNQGFTSYISVIGYYYGVTLVDAPDALGLTNNHSEIVDDLKQNVLHVCTKNVLEVGTKRVISVSEDEDMVQVAEILAQKKIKKVPVTSSGKLLGIISRGDVVRAVVKEFLSLQ